MQDTTTRSSKNVPVLLPAAPGLVLVSLAIGLFVGNPGFALMGGVGLWFLLLAALNAQHE